MKSDAFKYIVFYTISHLALSAIEIFFLKPLVDMFSTNFWMQILIYALLLLLINPIIIKFLAKIFIKEETVINQGE